MSLVPTSRAGDSSTPAVVGQVHKPEVCIGVMPGDTISKINGVAVTGCNFNGDGELVCCILCKTVIIQFRSGESHQEPSSSTDRAFHSSHEQ